ncbi:cysteine-rich venom protein piscivorin-like [Sceloporus undulatus]|uniref:cysteine-rich venom protein piscivorin-like n=1 Tax=Sceloporus undulatus TaxID=8520 RepID=UPI001C4ABB3F|nr:cysteine-rich venom protein piscivorin-like [Sceloporus undulatus]
MLLQILLFPLASMLQQTLGQINKGIVADISENQEKEIIEKHNEIRRHVQPTASNMMKMEWSTKASESAKKSVEKCRGTVSPKDELFVDGTFCIQIVLQSKQVSSWSDTIQVWNNTGVSFKYGIGATDPKNDISVYTQLVWHNSNQVGCALALCPMNKFSYFYLCNYCPAGNIVSQLKKPYKEGPPCGDCPKSCENKLCSSSCSYVDVLNNCDMMLQLFQGCNSKMVKDYCQATCNCGR